MKPKRYEDDKEGVIQNDTMVDHQSLIRWRQTTARTDSNGEKVPITRTQNVQPKGQDDPPSISNILDGAK